MILQHLFRAHSDLQNRESHITKEIDAAKSVSLDKGKSALVEENVWGF
jgi:hypothetical protein